MLKRRPSPTAVVAMLALFLALGGSAFAAKSYVITSSDQIKPSVLRALKGRRGARGARGAAGTAGPVGPAGPAGPSAVSALTRVTSTRNTIPGGRVGTAIATCPAGSRVVSGGGAVITSDWNGLTNSQPSSDQTSWFAITGNTSLSTGTIEAYALCAASGQAVAAGGQRAAARERAEREVAALVAQIEEAH